MERPYFFACLALGRLLRSARYSRAQVNDENARVRKSRRFYAPLLIWIGDPLLRLLDTGVRILPQRDWEERERLIYRTLHGTAIRVEANGTLVLPRLAGQTLAALLERADLSEPDRKAAIERSVVALAEFHRRGFTHADAIAENVLVARPGSHVARPGSQGRDIVANWFDFETVHDSSRPAVWRRADDVRALLVTCLIRTPPEKRGETLELVLDVYGDEDVARVMASNFTSVWRRSLPFHLAQAPMTFQSFKQINVLLCSRARVLTC